ncbi:hypothetical protein N8484_03225 [Akkermansiaceae bacterium]|nr:hypothetical protein [Akkermansiaceae bacterium]
MSLEIKLASECAYDILSMGEIMLRLDPGDGRVRTTRQFQAWEGGGDKMTSVHTWKIKPSPSPDDNPKSQKQIKPLSPLSFQTD